jgi:hypothetical protein
VTAVVAVILVRLLSVSQRYPFYFIWDMDHIVELDSLLVNSGLLPDNISHPGFGMYFLETSSQKVARAVNVISVSTLSDVEESLNPVAAVAELTDFIRRHTPFLCTAIVLILWTALILNFALPWWCGLLCLLVLGSQEALTYHSSMIRVEVYSVFFWSCATLAAAGVARMRRAPLRGLGHLGVGLLCGLAFLTKVQALFYLVGTVCILLLFESLAQDGTDHPWPLVSRRHVYGLISLSLLSLVFFSSLTAVAFATDIPVGVATFSKTYVITPLAWGLGLGMVGLLAVHVMTLTSDRISPGCQRIAALLTVLAAGFCLSFGFHFLIDLQPAVAWTYLVYDFKMLFLRNTFYEFDPSAIWPVIVNFVGHNPLLYLSHLGLLAVLVIGAYKHFLRVSRQQIYLCAVATLIVTVNLALGSRFILRDSIWAEMLITFLSVSYFAMIVTLSVRYRRFLGVAGAILMVALFAINCILSHEMLKRIDANFNQYGWRPDRWTAEVYTFNQQRYTKILREKYDKDNLPLALRAAIDHQRIRSIAEFVFPNQSPNHRNIGVAAVGLPVWAQFQNYRIADLPAALQRAIVVDPSSVLIDARQLFRPEWVRAQSEAFDKFRASGSTDVLAVLTRHDLQILMFVRGDDFTKFQNSLIQATALTITLRNGAERLEMKGLEITNYSEIPVRDCTYNYFFVIVPA